nr:uncharacterized protein LOC129274773 [Lytechinus pictus]
MGMSTQVYEALNNVSWHCIRCGMPQFSSSLFNSTSIEVSNSFDVLGSSNDVTTSSTETNHTRSLSFSEDGPGSPQRASTPVRPRRSSSLPPNGRSSSEQARNKRQHIKPRTMKVLNINFQSIRNKKEELAVLIETTEPSVIIGTETWLNPTIKSSEIFPSNFEVIRKDRADSYGGVLLAIRNDLIYDIIDTTGTGEQVFVKLSFGANVKLIIGALYRPPNSDINYLNDLCSTVENVASKNKKAALWIGGDLNLPDIDWTNLSVSGHNYPASMNNRLLNMTHDCTLQQMVTFPTRLQSTLDLFLTNRPSLVNKCSPLPGLGDHDIVGVDTDVTAKRRKPVKRLMHIWKNANLSEMKRECGLYQQRFIKMHDEKSSVINMWEEIKTFLQDLLQKHVPSKMTSSRFNQPWINSLVKQLSRRKKRAFKRARVYRAAERFP